MLETSLKNPTYDTASQAERKGQLRKWAWILFTITLTLFLPYSLVTEALKESYYNDVSASTAAWIILIGIFIAIIREPRYGIYAIMLFALMGDNKMSWWLPFTKNFSSKESLLYLSDSLPFSPQELCIALVIGVWLARMIIRREYKLEMTDLFWPVMIFTGFLGFGLLYGISQGGAANIAMWESRPIFYMTAMFLMSSNLLTERKHYNILIWFIMIALFFEGIIGIWYTMIWEQFDLSSIDDLAEHSAAQHMNTIYIFAIASWLYLNVSLRKRFIIPILCLPVVIIYILSQRRAAFLTMGIALVIMCFILYHERRMLFWHIIPPIAIIAVIYVGVFWNSTSKLALPAQAIKSVVSEDDSNAADRASNEYRDIENLNSEFTIKAKPLTGVGFGNKFYLVYAMPDISFFEWWEYITHNSIIWVWMKTGMFGFISMVYMAGMSIVVGARATWRMPRGDMQPIALTLTLYLMMHFIFAYVDMSWTDQSMLYVGVSMGVVSSIEKVVAKPLPTIQKRWPWQPDPESADTLKPIAHTPS